MNANDCITPIYVVYNLFHAHQCADIYSAPSAIDPIAFTAYLPYFLKTCLLEFPIYYGLLKKIKSFKQLIAINFAVNLATHPIVFFVIPVLVAKLNGNYLNFLITAEIFAPAVEALLLIFLFKISPKRAIAAAVAANLFSWSVGVYW